MTYNRDLPPAESLGTLCLPRGVASSPRLEALQRLRRC